MQLLIPKTQVASVALISWLIPFSICTPFGTVNSPALHQHAEHQMITRLAFRCPDGQKSDGICFETQSLDNLAGSVDFNGAVGSPDTVPPEDAVAHCDDADFLNIPGYPQSRAAATTQLQACVDHLRLRFGQGIRGAGRMVDSDNKLISAEVDLLNFGQCDFNHRGITDDMINRGKCVALEGLGRALHGTEDFYSHSNWADRADPNRPISVTNPPGLDLRTLASFLDLRAINNITSQVPIDLTTGCFNVAEMLPGNGGTGSFGCLNRVIHMNLNKDHGVITLDGTITADPHGVPREAVPGNFARAVLSAVQDARERWKNFRDELRRQHGPEKASLVICALVRDDPAKDCRNRKISIVVDSSGSNMWTDPSNLRIQAAKDFNARLTTAAQAGPGIVPDKVAVVDFDDSARVLYPMGDPAGATGTFDALDSNGGTDIGSGIALGIDEIMKDEPGLFAKRAGIVVLTDGEDFNPANQILQLARARVQGIRVNYGFLSPPPVPVTRKRSLVKRDPDPDVVAAILSTGGTFGIITSAKAQKNFINLVIARGATEIDAPVGSTILTSGVTVTENVTPEKSSHDFTYSASAGEHMNFTLTVVSGSQGLNAVLRNIRENADVETMNATVGSPLAITFDALARTELELIVSTPENATSEIIFSVGMDTNMPEKNETTTTPSIMPSTTSSILTVTPSANVTTASMFNATSTTMSSTADVTTNSHVNTTLPSAFSSTALSTNASGVYPHSTSKAAYPTSHVTHVTKVYTSVCTTQVVTTVCDGPDTRVLAIYPTSRLTSVITTAIPEYPATTLCSTSIHKGASYPAYPMSSAGYSEATPSKLYSVPSHDYTEYPKATSPPHSHSSPAYPSGWDEYVSSAYEHLQDGSSLASTKAYVASPYPSAPRYSEGHSASYGHSYVTGPAIETFKYGSTLPLPPPSAPTHLPPSSSAAHETAPYPPASPSSPPALSGYSEVTITVVSLAAEQTTSPAYPLNTGSPSASPYAYSNATPTYNVGNSTATTAEPVLYTGGAMTHVVRDMVGGVAGAVVAVMGLGILLG